MNKREKLRKHLMQRATEITANGVVVNIKEALNHESLDFFIQGYAFQLIRRISPGKFSVHYFPRYDFTDKLMKTP